MSKPNTIRVGIVGATGNDNPQDMGWANAAHLPALAALPEYAVGGFTARRAGGAADVAQALGVPTFPDAAALASSPAVDLVAVTVRVPAHREVVLAALGAGKAVYCEWPLANGVAEAEELVAAADAAGVPATVGLQARVAPLVRYVRELVAEGFVGEVLSTTLIGTGMNWGPGMLSRNAYTLDKANGATVLTIPLGHALDALQHCLGPLTEVRAVSALRRPEVVYGDNGETGHATAEDQWVVAGRLAGGAVASIHYRGGAVAGDNLRWEINGTHGDLVVTSGFGHLQAVTAQLAGARSGEPLAPMPIPERFRVVPELPDPALNVAQVYALHAAGSDEVATFAEALALHRTLDAIDRAAETGAAVACD